MAEDMDPATAALLRAMHREMNGLTRGRSRLTSTEPKIKRQRLNESQSSTSEESRRAVDADHSSKNGLTRPQAASAGASRPLRRLQKQPSAAAAAQEASRKPHGSGELRTSPHTQQQQQPAHTHPQQPKQQQQQGGNSILSHAQRLRDLDQRQDEGSRAGHSGPLTVHLKAANSARRTASQPQQSQQQQQQQGLGPGQARAKIKAEHGCASQPALPALMKQPSHEEASGAAWTRDQASAATSEAQAKAQRSPLPPELSRFKCFCQGVVYGLNLKAEVLRSREALFAALRACLEDERWKQAAGSALQVILIDDNGQIVETPPAGSDQQWPNPPARIRRAYVSLV